MNIRHAEVCNEEQFDDDFGHFGQTWALNIEDECEAVVVFANPLFEHNFKNMHYGKYEGLR